MKIKELKIPLYGYDLAIVQLEASDTSQQIARLLQRRGLSKDELDEELYYHNGELCFQTNRIDGGITLSNPKLKQIIVLFYPFSSEIERENVFSHEKRHVEDRLLRYAQIDDYESAGLLAGWLGVKFYEFKKTL